MSNRCPSCSKQLAAFALHCDSCDWAVSMPKESELAKPQVSSDTASTTAAVQQQTVNKTAPANSNSQREAEAHLQKAMVRIEKESFEAAIRSINRAIVAAPVDRLGECYSLRGYCHLKLDDFQRSEKDCTEAIHLDWSEPQTYAWRAAARGERNYWRLALGDLEKAWKISHDNHDQFVELMDSYASACEQWFAEQEKTAETFTEMGWVHLSRNRFAKAEDCFQKALQLEADHSLAAAGLAKLIFDGKSTSGRYRSVRSTEVLQYADIAMQGSAEVHAIVLPIRIKIFRTCGDLDRAMEDLKRLATLAKDDAELAVRYCRLRYEAGDYMAATDELSAMLKDGPLPIDALLLRGDCYREIKNYPLAIEDYSSFLDLRPNDTDAISRLAECKLATGDIENALQDVNRAIELDGSCFSAYICRSKVRLQQTRLDDALTDCRKASTIDNSQPKVFATLASINSKLGRFTESVEEYSRAIELEDDIRLKANLLYLRGTTFYELKLFSEAYADFKKACYFRPNHAGNWIWKSAACTRLEKWTDAIASLQSAIAIRPSSQEEYRILGKPVAEKAIKFFDRQQQRGQTSAGLFQRRALALQFLGKFEQAIEDYTNALSLEPDNVETFIRRGEAWKSLGHCEHAVKDFKAAIKRDQENDQALYQLAQTRLETGEFLLAQRDIERAIDSSPRNVRSYGLYADILQKLGQQEGVIEALNRATLLDSTDPLIYQKRAKVHFQQKNYLNATSDFTRSLELSPNEPDVLLSRGQAYLKSEQPEQAIADFENVIKLTTRLSKAFSGRAAALAMQGHHVTAAIWLTKAFHRYQDRPRDLCELLFARGKMFVLMGRLAPAVDDFSTVAKLMRHDNSTVVAARYARGIARYLMNMPEKAIRDFNSVIERDPRNEHAALALKWLHDPQSCDKPSQLEHPPQTIRPTRPPVVRSPIKITTPKKNWVAEKPYQMWILRSLDKKEYGPISRDTLNQWIGEGRVDFGMKLLRADWTTWKRAEAIFQELKPVMSVDH